MSEQNPVEPNFEVFKRNANFVLVARDYGVIVQAPSLEAGYIELKARVTALEKEYEAAGVPFEKRELLAGQIDVKPRGYPIAQASSQRTIVIIVSVTAIFLVEIIFPIVQITSGIRQLISTTFPEGAHVEKAGRSAINFVGKLADAVDTMTPEREQELQNSIRRIARKVIPILDAARNPGAPATPTTSGPNPGAIPK